MQSLLRPLRQVKAPSSSHTIVSRLSSLANLHNELTTRKIPLSYDYLHPQPSHLLNLTLSDLLQTQTDQPQKQTPPTVLPSILNPSPLPIAYHLIYFPPQVSLSQLLPDGTDILHTPGDPFTRRLWAGGNIRFPGPASKPLLLDGSRAVCIESIRNVEIKGREGEEKVIVTIERRVGTVPEGEDELGSWERLWNQDESLDQGGQVSLIENRNLIFMRGKSGEQIAADKRDFENPSRVVKSPSNATFRQKIHPTKALLFRFSALTFNAHSIHLDKNYTQNEEGYRNCLVHGPLTLTVLLSVLQRHIEPLNLRVDHFEYRNLAPLFVGEDLTVCGKPMKSGEQGQGEGSWDVWIEGPDGGLAVRGTAKTAKSY